jgi:hypothetical protein
VSESVLTILVVAHSQYRGVYLGVAEKLQKELKAKVHLYVATPQEAEYYTARHNDFFESISVSNTLYDVCRESVTDEEAVIKTARENELKYGITINELAVSDRHLGRGFALAGFWHPRSRISENTNYIQMVNGFNASIDFWLKELKSKQPILILNAPKVLSVIARSQNIPVRILTGSRYRNYYYWAVNEFLETGVSLKDRMNLINKRDLIFDGPVSGYTAFRKKFDSETGLRRTIRRTAYMIARHLYWRFRRFEKARGYYLSENIRYIWRQRNAAKVMGLSSLPSLKDLKGKPFVFFPLATEPETALQQLSPEYLSQLSCIQAVCKYLPAGYTLVIKEHHTALGRRPRDFYKQISEFKNAAFINMRETGFSVVQQAAAVVTITGTAGFEAAVMGKPAIVFGRHVIYSELPHCFSLKEELHLSEALGKALTISEKKAARDGMHFLAALVDFSFDLGSYSQWEPDVIEQETVNKAFDNLMKNLDVSCV